MFQSKDLACVVVLGACEADRYIRRYRTYFNPTASGKRLIWMSHCIVIGYALFIATFSVGLYFAGISMGYLYLMMGVIISSAVLPATLTLTWSGQNRWAVSVSPNMRLLSNPQRHKYADVLSGCVVAHLRSLLFTGRLARHC